MYTYLIMNCFPVSQAVNALSPLGYIRFDKLVILVKCDDSNDVNHMRYTMLILCKFSVCHIPIYQFAC